jgi:hypothetical protein
MGVSVSRSSHSSLSRTSSVKSPSHSSSSHASSTKSSNHSNASSKQINYARMHDPEERSKKSSSNSSSCHTNSYGDKVSISSHAKQAKLHDPEMRNQTKHSTSSKVSNPPSRERGVMETVKSTTSSFAKGVVDGGKAVVKDTIEGGKQIIKHPVQTAKAAYEAGKQTAKQVVNHPKETVQKVIHSVEQKYHQFEKANPNQKAYMIGKGIAETAGYAVGSKGATAVVKQTTHVAKESAPHAARVLNNERGSIGKPHSKINEVNKVNQKNNRYDVEIAIPRSKFPETAQHIHDAIKAGHPDILTIDRPNAKANRKEALQNHSKVPGKQLDEYPPAMFKEGGRGASVRPISPSDNMGAGAYMGNKLRPHPNGTKVKIKVGD